MDIKNKLKKLISSRFVEPLKVTGEWQIRCFKADGNLKWKDTGHNLVVTTGLQHVADQMSDQGETAMSHIAAGSDNTAPALGNTTLGTELGRVAFDSKTQNGTSVDYVGIFPAGTATGTWEEIGMFNAGAGGVMVNRLLSGTKTKGAGETFEVTIALTFS